MTAIAVRVPETDVEDLQDLIRSIGVRSKTEVAHPFDGETVVQAVVLLSAGAYPFFRSWVSLRTAQRKRFSVVHNGTELKGYTSAEAQRILTTIASAVPELDQSDASLELQPNPETDVSEQGNS